MGEYLGDGVWVIDAGDKAKLTTAGGPSYMNVETDFTENERVVGIISYAYDKEDCIKGGVDTRVDAWLDWIDEQMRAACTDGTRSWRNVLGIISAEYDEPKPEVDGGVVAGDGGEESKSGRGVCRLGEGCE